MTLHTSISLQIVASFLLVLAGNVRPVDAQTADRKWELEFHAGGMFSTNPTAGVTGLAPSTLSGPAITGHRTWSGSGVARHTNIAAGVFWRF